jgi:hypothetical protein
MEQELSYSFLYREACDQKKMHFLAHINDAHWLKDATSQKYWP